MSLASLCWRTKFQCKNEIKKQLVAQILFKKFWFCDQHVWSLNYCIPNCINRKEKWSNQFLLKWIIIHNTSMQAINLHVVKTCPSICPSSQTHLLHHFDILPNMLNPKNAIHPNFDFTLNLIIIFRKSSFECQRF
jgi:hypothetical protein